MNACVVRYDYLYWSRVSIDDEEGLLSADSIRSAFQGTSERGVVLRPIPTDRAACKYMEERNKVKQSRYQKSLTSVPVCPHRLQRQTRTAFDYCVVETWTLGLRISRLCVLRVTEERSMAGLE